MQFRVHTTVYNTILVIFVESDPCYFIRKAVIFRKVVKSKKDENGVHPSPEEKNAFLSLLLCLK
jgi:hypothetical protein